MIMNHKTHTLFRCTAWIHHKSISDNNNNVTIYNENVQDSRTQTRSRVRSNDILNSGVRTRSMVAESLRVYLLQQV